MHKSLLYPKYSFLPAVSLGWLTIFLFGAMPASAQRKPAPYPPTSPVNYVRTWVAQRPITDAAQLINTANNPLDAVVTTDYFDGLGRPLQTVVRQGSLNTANNETMAYDLVKPMEYDAFGRNAYQYLPYPDARKTTGAFVTDPFDQQAIFYNHTNAGQNPIAGQGETFFYSKTNFEPSPLNRVTETFAPGNSWVGAEIANAATNKSVKQQYFINTDVDEVRIWNVTEPIAPADFGSYTSPNIYLAGQLYKTITVDEHGKQVIEFKDKSGQVILKKVQLGNATDNGSGANHDPLNWICTYYVYDDFGSLRCVVQPEGVKWLNGSNWNFSAANGPTVLAEQCFRYEYDARRRMITKKVPGAGLVYMVYDRYDRLLLTQDANQRPQGQWLFTKYDALNRPVLTGIYTYWGTIADARYLANYDIGYRFESFISNDAEKIFYTKNCWPQSNYEALTATYYDNYNWVVSLGDARFLANGTMRQDHLNEGSFFVQQTNTAPDYVQPLVADYNVKGLPTGTRVKELGSPTFQSTATYYDQYGRPIQTLATADSNSYVWGYTQYDFAGRMRRSLQKTYCSGNGQTYYVATALEYDALGRPSATKKTINYGAQVTTATLKYDALGQLKKKDLGQKRDAATAGNPYLSVPLEMLQYDYNIRGWLLGVNRDFLSPTVTANPGTSNWFGFELGYNKANHKGSSSFWSGNQYNGNIQGQAWRSVGDGVQRQYSYKYDAANRILAADFEQRNADASWNNSAMDFTFWTDHHGTGVNPAYDLNGNLLQFGHRGFKPAANTMSERNIDILWYNYQPFSNKLANVVDWVGAPQNLGDFTDKNTSGDDYGYDANGNLVTDLNKRLNGATGSNLSTGGAIGYNHLNLPTSINVKKEDGTAKGTITYTYDAAGTKLKKVTVDQSTSGKTITTTTHYAGAMVYESRSTTPADAANPDYNYKLQFISQEEGRLRPIYTNTAAPDTATGYAYDYMLKDHLGNVRMVLTDEVKKDEYPTATMEDGNASSETVFYSKINETRATRHVNMPADGSTNPNSKAAMLSNSGQRVGPGILLKVQAGDELELWCRSWWQGSMGGQSNSDQSGVQNAVAGIFGNMLPAISGGKINSGQAGTNSSFFAPGILSFLQAENPTPTDRPKAFVNWMFLNDQFQYTVGNGSGSESVSIANDYKLH